MYCLAHAHLYRVHTRTSERDFMVFRFSLVALATLFVLPLAVGPATKAVHALDQHALDRLAVASSGPVGGEGLLILLAQVALIAGFGVQRLRRRVAEEDARRSEASYQRILDSQQARSGRAEDTIGRLEARNSAILRALPDLMFVMARDGTYLDFHARDLSQLLVPPDQFLGKKMGDVLPPDLSPRLMNALETAFATGDTIVAEYSLAFGGLKYYEARIVAVDTDRALSIVRDVTHARKTQDMNRSLAGRLLTSQEAERTRIARDLHDGVCQEVASITVDVSYLRQRIGELDNADVQVALLEVERRAASVAEALRRLSHGLHPTVLHHIGLVAALQSHCAEVERQHHLRLTFESNGEIEPVGQRVALSLFRIAQEALRNATRHGRAHHATVSLLRRADGGLEMSVVDDGVGFDPGAGSSSGGLGLVSIEERARLVKGDVDITSAPGQGTSVRVRVPAAAFGTASDSD